MKIAKIASIAEVLNKILSSDNELSGGSMYRITKIAKDAASKADAFFSTRDALIKKYGSEKDGSVGIAPDSDNWEQFVKEMNDASDDDINFEHKIKLSDIEDVKISGQHMVVLEEIIVEE